MNDSIPQRIIIETVDKGGFFTTDNPFWIILTVVVTSVLTYLFAYLLKKKEYRNISQQMLMEKRLEAHREIFIIFNKAYPVNDLGPVKTKTYFVVFETQSKWQEWFVELQKFYLNNYVYLTKDLCLSVNKLRLVQALLYHLYYKNRAGFNFKEFCRTYYRDISKIFNDIDIQIANFFEKEINRNYYFPVRNLSDFDIIYEELDKLSMFKETIGTSKYLKSDEDITEGLTKNEEL